MDWLLEHGSDPDATQPLSEAELRELGRRHRRRQRVNLAAFRPAAAAPSQGPASTTAFDAPPPAALVETLVEMGFESGAARGALAAFRNNVEMACHWLLTAGSRPGAVPPAPPTQRQPRQGPLRAQPLPSTNKSHQMRLFKGHASAASRCTPWGLSTTTTRSIPSLVDFLITIRMCIDVLPTSSDAYNSACKLPEIIE